MSPTDLPQTERLLARYGLHLDRSTDHWRVQDTKNRRVMRLYLKTTPNGHALKLRVNTTKSSREYPMTTAAQNVPDIRRDALAWLEVFVQVLQLDLPDVPLIVVTGTTDGPRFEALGYTRIETSAGGISKLRGHQYRRPY